MYNKEIIKEKVRELRALPFVGGVFPVPIEAIASHLGFGCYFFDPDERTIGISGAVNHKSKKIFINRDDAPQRQLFTVAHEIGHITLHGVDEDYIDYRASDLDETSKGKEFEANQFAAELLMPEEIFKLQWHAFKHNINKLSQFFGVSPSAIGVRANALGLD